MTERTMYVLATDRMTWGKGMTDVEALFNALRHGADAKQINLMTITKIPEDVDLWTSCGMNELGQVFYPKGSKVEQIVIDVPDWMGRKFADVFADMQNILKLDIYRAKPDKIEL